MFPLMASSISASVGFGFFASSAAADMICPDWQYPHCGTSSSIQAFCTGCDASVESPSIVVIFFPATLETGVMHERVASPLMCTVQAPQSAMPQPNFVPVMFSVSRSTQRSGICGSTSTVVDLPFSVNVVPMIFSPNSSNILQHPATVWKSPKNHQGCANSAELLLCPNGDSRKYGRQPADDDQAHQCGLDQRAPSGSFSAGNAEKPRAATPC